MENGDVIEPTGSSGLTVIIAALVRGDGVGPIQAQQTQSTGLIRAALDRKVTQRW
jgi:hypothetical protein